MKEAQAEQPWEWTWDRKEEKGELGRDATMWRQPKITTLILGELCEVVSHYLEAVKKEPGSKYVRELQ